MKIYDFIKDGLDTFFNNGGKYDTKLRDICIELNELLNNVTNNNYEEYLRENKDKIRGNINKIFKILNSNGFLYINLKFLLDWFYEYQEKKEIKNEKEKKGKQVDEYRDHFFHCIQCFLLALTIVNKFTVFYALKKDKNLVPKIFQTTIYHDIGYLYKLKNRFGPGYNRINLIENDLGMRICKDLSTELLSSINVIEAVCNISIYKKIDDNKLSQIKKYIHDEFYDPYNQNNLNEIEDKTGYNYPPTSKEHSYNSAIILSKFYALKRSLNRMFNTKAIPIQRKENENEKIFLGCWKSITLHAMKLVDNADNRFSITEKPLEALLMIVDELQTYGRIPNTEDGKQLLHPKDVEFEFDSNKKLTLTNSVDSKEHTTEQIVKELEKRIKEKSLETIFNISYIKKILIRKICKILNRNI